MNIVAKILPRFAILRIFFEDAGSYVAELAIYNFNGFATELQASICNAIVDHIEKEAKGLPLFIAYGGFGVISKEVATNLEIVEKVKNDNDSFVWDEVDRHIAFLRKDRVSEVFSKYRLEKNTPLAMFCFTSGTPLSLQKESLDRSLSFYEDVVNLPVMLKPSVAGSVLCRMIVSKLKLPIFAILLLILVVNVFANKNIRVNHGRSEARLEQLERERGRGNEVALRNKQMFAEFNRKPPFEYSWLCDRMGIVLPEGITLTLVTIQPMQKALEEGKKPMVEHDRIMIKGVAQEADDISYYTVALGKLIRSANVKLISVERTRDADMLDFSISIDLL